MMVVTLATTNQHKVLEVEPFLDGLDIEVVGRPLGCPAVAETGDTFEENAILKALAVARWTGGFALSDDSGLEVDALGGAPGVRSARFAGEHATDAMNRSHLLQLLSGRHGRAARFRCVLALCDANGACVSFSGEVDGLILDAEVGGGGFGYDPIFAPNEGGGRSFSEMTKEEKSQISHRGRALRQLREFLQREQWWRELTLPS